ncbi:DNA polymerase III subunit delta' [Mycoavidus cysteinexigens]|uniref:DNA polymerase III subunit delta' n=1 Tax=Mycoavidus cysteinexigens TaxID=1553431 RepID=A0A2Z6EUS9_9BURK|nr:DNA polymerase III subunit delta' [Mycoavidus cysteinexigens]BBE09172.1 DNA polymerase III subunit delta' [Mycoavidus cysteinexigens]GAM52083.1 DNA polymerase III delta prime subunit [bacterium endosymbiont of Mortierella elongata FMR23-6]GLR01881.1 DNA polymerase III subunit delta' [Mycoavidus cysteinexigens]
MTPTLYPWQRKDWQRLYALRPQWPSALLFHGQAGIGKVSFARYLAQGLLCEMPLTDGQPCNECAACHWFVAGNHPDYRILCPENLAPAASDTAATQPSREEAQEPEKKTRAPSKEIKIEQVRALLDFCALGSHRSGRRVILLHPVEALNTAAANALLKTLEEPPVNVVFLLICTQITQLLPTIVSRCRRWPMHLPEPSQALDWLHEQGLEDAASALAHAAGSPLTALADARDENGALRRFALDQLAAGIACDPFACGANLHKVPIPLVLSWLQAWLYDLTALRLANQIRYHPADQQALARCAQHLNPLRLVRYARTVNLRRVAENHPLNARLVFEELFLEYRSIFTIH